MTVDDLSDFSARLFRELIFMLQTNLVKVTN